MATTQLDATGFKCPIPVLKARKVIRDLAHGDMLEVLSTDPGSVPDFEAFCRTTGNELVEQETVDDVFRFLLRKA